MICAHTVRKVKPGMAKRFLDGFTPPMDEEAPPGWVRFNALVGIDDPDTVVTFGFFDGTLEQLERSQADADFDSRRAAIDPLVDADGQRRVWDRRDAGHRRSDRGIAGVPGGAQDLAGAPPGR